MPHEEAASEVGVSPYDTAASAVTRFLVEVAAWVAGPWAAASLTGREWLAVPVLVVLVAIPATFSTMGDKKSVVVATPGPTRIVIELFLLAVAVAAAAIVWPTPLVVGVAIIGIVMLVTGADRYRWLAKGAPLS